MLSTLRPLRSFRPFRRFMLALMLLPLCVGRQAAANAPTWWLVDATDAAGLSSAHGYVTMPISEPQKAAGGVAAGDFDNDGFTDLYVVAGPPAATDCFATTGTARSRTLRMRRAWRSRACPGAAPCSSTSTATAGSTCSWARCTATRRGCSATRETARSPTSPRPAASRSPPRRCRRRRATTTGTTGSTCSSRTGGPLRAVATCGTTTRDGASRAPTRTRASAGWCGICPTGPSPRTSSTSTTTVVPIWW